VSLLFFLVEEEEGVGQIITINVIAMDAFLFPSQFHWNKEGL
jgi:hypothetical protein